ncbi:MAG: hypothetical protein HYT20_03740 [Candidatus Nealsonbacteria bacterium]|nr:hypothetical protein [Candidatus Nealsonbacteria bacterium]
MKNNLRKIVCLLHYGIGFAWFGLFFLPASVWPDKVSFHFFLSVVIIGHQFVWGNFIKLRTGKFRPTCFLTTITQKLRGWAVSDPHNYNYSFTQEIFKNFGISIPQEAVKLIALGIFASVTVQYFFFR